MAEEPVETEGVEEKRRGATLAIAGGILAGLLVGGVAVFFVVRDDAPKDDAGDAAEVEQAKPKEPAADLLLVRRRRLAVPLINAKGESQGYMWVDLTFEVDGPENQSYVSARLPRLVDAYLRDLHARQTTRSDRPGAMDFDLLRDRLRALTDATVGEGRVLEVRITNAMRVPE